MKNFLKIFSPFILTLFTISCSTMVEDLAKMTKGSKYVVEHYQEIVAEYDAASRLEDGVFVFTQNNYEKDENGNPKINPLTSKPDVVYTLFESETFFAEPDSMSQAAAKSYKGFTAVPFEQKKVTSDNECVVKIYYTRNEVTITADVGEGIWNYSQVKADPSTPEDKTPRKFKKKYGSIITLNIAEDLLKDSGKKSCVLTKYILSDGTETTILPVVFPAEDVIYTAIWEEGKPAHYKVAHYFEKTTCTDNSIENDTNYDLNIELTNVKYGVPETETSTQENVATVPGFTAKPHSEAEIAANGSTVVYIYYVRNNYDIKIATDEGLWNYDAWKADKQHVTQNTETKTISGRYGTSIDWSSLNSLKKTGMNFVGLKNNETNELFAKANLPQTMPAGNINYTAVWAKKDRVPYEVKFMIETVGSTDSDDVNNYIPHSNDRTKTGTPEYYTEAVAIEIPGFTAKEIEQQEIKEDQSTIVYVYYKRNTTKITFDLNGGYWNYASYRLDKEHVTPDSASKQKQGKFETAVDFPDFTEMGKRANDFNCWKDLATQRTFSTAELAVNYSTFGSSDVILQAQWTKGTGYEYKVRHWFEKVTSRDSSNHSNYELRADLTQTELGEEINDDTDAVAKSIDGFTAQPFAQKKVAADGSTVVDIYYERNTSKFIFDVNGGTIASGSATVTGKYESEFDMDDTPVASRTGWTFGGWTYKGRLVTNEDLKLENQTFDAEDKTFKAYWVSTVSVTGTTTFGDIVLTKDQNTTKVECYVTLPAGYESQNWTYKWYVDGVYASDEVRFVRTPAALGRGVHTITVKATMNGQNFTQRVTATIE